jgi:long-chain acyl-CoA synthetase
MWKQIRAHATRRPHDLAVADSTGSVSWQELVGAVERRAADLADGAAMRGPVAGLHRANDVGWVVDFLALRVLGRCVLPLPAALPDGPADRAAAAVGASCVVRAHQVTLLDAAPTAENLDLLAASALIHSTSGTTGLARGVPRSEENLFNEADAVAEALDLDPRTPVLCATPVSHSFASGLLLGAFASGAPTILQQSFDPSALLALAREHRPAVVAGTPYVFLALVGSRRSHREELASLRMPVCGGAPLHETWALSFLAATGVPICQEYGLSEGGIATVNLAAAEAAPTSVGLPIRDVEITVVDASGENVPAGTAGRIIIDRPHQPRFYLDEGDAPVPIPTSNGSVPGIDTGDLGYLDEAGRLHLAGRSKAHINVGGVKVHAATIERHLIDHPLVVDAVIVGIEDPFRGESVAAMVQVADEKVRTADLVEHLRQHVAPYALPRRWLLRPRLPRTPTGKPDRSRVKFELEGL